MNDTAIKNYAVWARRELIGGVRLQMARWAIDEEGSVPASADVLRGEPLNARQRTQRAELLEACRKEGADALVERAAYTWFNRLAAIRFMELHDYLPCGMRMLSAPDGSFDPQALREALHVDIEGLDRAEMAALVQAGEREPQFRYLLLCQCDELASCMPAVFERVGSAMELLLPDNLLGEGSVVERMVSDIPESDWTEGVEIVGWMYQYYVSERKDEAFASFKKGKKADRSSIAPATQLFTPAWIVRYLVENSLGRLWMLNRPSSLLVEEMPYFVKPDEGCETEFKKISGPEDITVADPACGSGHILVYAFDLLAKMYLEDGYTARDAARLILEKNISGMEIDPRAAAMASFALTMKALELDSRFLRRAVAPRITVLSRVEFESEELELLPMLAKRPELFDAAAHLDECGSLLEPSEADMAAVAGDLASLAGEPSLFAASAAAKLGSLASSLEALNGSYDAVVANPPYMGAKNMNAWLSGWTKKIYPDAKNDFCTCFIERGFTLAAKQGYSAMVTMESWMFLSGFEKMRKNILRKHSIATMVYMNHMVMRIAFNTCATVFRNEYSDLPGLYTKVEYEDIGKDGAPVEFPVKRHAPARNEGDLQALADPDCGWFYRADAKSFEIIPGSPIAYWASSSMIDAFRKSRFLGETGRTSKGLITGDNNRFLRLWWECGSDNALFYSKSFEDILDGRNRWFACTKGGPFRKWAGNTDWVVDWRHNGEFVKSAADETGHHCQDYNDELKFKKSITWSAISSDAASFRYAEGTLSEHAGMCCFLPERIVLYALALLNSSVVGNMMSLIAPTLNFNAGDVDSIPLIANEGRVSRVNEIAGCNISFSQCDWDSRETSWNFERHRLV